MRFKLGKCGSFCCAAGLLSRRSEPVLQAPLPRIRANRIFNYASISRGSNRFRLCLLCHSDVPVGFHFLRGRKAGGIQLHSTVTSQCRMSTRLTRIDRLFCQMWPTDTYSKSFLSFLLFFEWFAKHLAKSSGRFRRCHRSTRHPHRFEGKAFVFHYAVKRADWPPS